MAQYGQLPVITDALYATAATRINQLFTSIPGSTTLWMHAPGGDMSMGVATVYSRKADGSDVAVAGAGAGSTSFKGGINAATTALPFGATTQAGDNWVVTVAGDFLGSSLVAEVGDGLIALIDSPAVDADFLLMQGNITVTTSYEDVARSVSPKVPQSSALAAAEAINLAAGATQGTATLVDILTSSTVKTSSDDDTKGLVLPDTAVAPGIKAGQTFYLRHTKQPAPGFDKTALLYPPVGGSLTLNNDTSPGVNSPIRIFVGDVIKVSVTNAASNIYLVENLTENSVGISRPSTETGITAFAGGGQANAYQLSSKKSKVTVVAAPGDSTKLPKAFKDLEMTIVNADAANAMDLFPDTGDNFETLAANVAISLAAGASIDVICFANGEWSVL